MSKTTPVLRQALEYAKRGWAVFPVWGCWPSGACRCRRGKDCQHIGKHPWTEHGFRDATTDATRIRAWEDKWETANIGIATGEASGLVVLDIDSLKGGEASMEKLIARLGPLPRTLMVRTGNGWHLYFEHPGGRFKSVAEAIAPGVDIRADGGYVVAPPSRHQSGRAYQWEPGRGVFDGTLGRLPEKWLDELGRLGCYIDGAESTVTTEDLANTEAPVDPGGRRQHGHGEGGEGEAQPARRSGQALPAYFLQMPTDEFLEWTIRHTLPTGPGRRHHQVFLFAKILKGHPEISRWDASKLIAAAVEWYKAAVDALGEGQIKAGCDENTADFLEAWDNVHTPGVGIAEQAFSVALEDELPKAAHLLVDDASKRLLAACREMQRLVGDGQPWYLSTRQVCRLMPEFEQRMSVYRTLSLFERLGFLEIVERGSPTGRKATSYRYLLPLDE